MINDCNTADMQNINPAIAAGFPSSGLQVIPYEAFQQQLTMPTLPATRSAKQAMDINSVIPLTAKASETLNAVTAEITERLSGTLTKGTLDDVSTQDLRRYLDVHQAYLNEVMPDTILSDPKLNQALQQQYGEVEKLKIGFDEFNSPASKKEITTADYNQMNARFADAENAVAMVTAEIQDRLGGTDFDQRLNGLSNDKLYGFLGYFQEQYLKKDMGLWQRAASRNIGDSATNQRIADGLTNQLGAVQGLRLALSENGFVKPDTNIQYLNQYTQNYAPMTPNQTRFNGANTGGYAGYMDTSAYNQAHYGLGTNAQPKAYLGSAAPYQVNYGYVAM
jgi:hypothetical protein